MVYQSAGLPVKENTKYKNNESASLPVDQSAGLPVKENTENKIKIQNTRDGLDESSPYTRNL